MSDREWLFYISDMIQFSHNVETYTEGLDQAAFEQSGLNYDATVRNLELIGEAARHIPDEVRAEYSAIPWRQMVATRNQLIHGYLGIDNDILWNIIKKDIPSLRPELERLKAQHQRKINEGNGRLG